MVFQNCHSFSYTGLGGRISSKVQLKIMSREQADWLTVFHYITTVQQRNFFVRKLGSESFWKGTTTAETSRSSLTCSSLNAKEKTEAC